MLTQIIQKNFLDTYAENTIQKYASQSAYLLHNYSGDTDLDLIYAACV